MSTTAFPFLRPKASRVKASPWLIVEEGQRAPLAEELTHWDPGTRITLTRTVKLDVEGVTADCRLKLEDRLRLVTVWRSEGTKLRGHGAVVDLTAASGRFEGSLEVQLEGHELGERIDLETQLVFVGRTGTGLRFAPRRPGSLLWTDLQSVTLDAQAARFPIELVDFKTCGWLEAEAAWALEWNPDDLHQPVNRSTRLYVNAAKPLMAGAITAVRPVDAQAVVQQFIRFDVARTMIVGALENEEFVRAPRAFAEDTVGASMRRLLGALFPDEDIAAVAERRRQARGGFEAELQARLRLLSEGG